jgi:hypothetical protein
MSGFLETVRKSDGERRYYVGGCRVTRNTFESVGDGRKDCFQTQDKGTHWRHRHVRRL